MRIPLGLLVLVSFAACTDPDKTQPEAMQGGAAGATTTPGKAGPCSPRPVSQDAAPTCSDDGSSGLPPCEQWTKVEPPGAVCSDGSPYKFFVNFTKRSHNLVFMFEPGGACWDYASCSGGARGAANPHGIPDDHMAQLQYLNLLRRTDDNPARDFNLVFVSYCTGDVHTGDRVVTYENPSGGEPLTFRHAGLSNTRKVIDWVAPRFKDVPQLLVTGCSAGGIGALNNYVFVRDGLAGTQCGYLLDDSGPAFHSDGPSHPLHDKVRESWNLDHAISELSMHLPVSSADLIADYGKLNAALAERFPKDRLSLAVYRMDLNYSLYSYETFFPGSSEDQIHAMWWTDLQQLMRSYDAHDNLAYFVPYFRTDNCSHCVSIPPLGHDIDTVLGKPWLGSEIESHMLTLKDFVSTLLDDSGPLKSYVEDPHADERFTPEASQKCLVP
ncbi:MAG TPA: pectin acetylesterase-family hydrolase [Polyangiales bacterium]|nr:pectin acetylesterase-family hydrolase [Polyangiales bacterium]